MSKSPKVLMIDGAQIRVHRKKGGGGHAWKNQFNKKVPRSHPWRKEWTLYTRWSKITYP